MLFRNPNTHSTGEDSGPLPPPPWTADFLYILSIFPSRPREYLVNKIKHLIWWIYLITDSLKIPRTIHLKKNSTHLCVHKKYFENRSSWFIVLHMRSAPLIKTVWQKSKIVLLILVLIFTNINTINTTNLTNSDLYL